MAILVIGNGFDLAHSLPTAYPTFLDFVKMFKSDGKAKVFDDEVHSELTKFIKQIRAGSRKTEIEAVEALNRRNVLLDYFLEVYDERCKNGKYGWIDFESEILTIVQLLHQAIDEEHSKVKDVREPYELSRALCEKMFTLLYVWNNKDTVVPTEFYPGDFSRLSEEIYADLNQITRLFEIYITNFVEKWSVSVRIPEIWKLKNIDKIISFNYTNTYQRLYSKGKEQYCYIHGKADEDSNLISCNLVLGINEYQDTVERDIDNRFIWFKKFYQRIFKETDSNYIDWLDHHKWQYSQKGMGSPLDIYFYGHSLNETDKDVLYKLIMHEHARIHIFYHRKDIMATQISNLVKIISEENLIKMTRGEKRKIEFLPTKQAMPIEILKAMEQEG